MEWRATNVSGQTAVKLLWSQQTHAILQKQKTKGIPVSDLFHFNSNSTFRLDYSKIGSVSVKSDKQFIR